MRRLIICCLALTVISCASQKNATASKPGTLPTVGRKSYTADESLQWLIDGNKRFAAKDFSRPHQTLARRLELAKKQEPFAIILSCADSRVPSELVFDQGLGDLFVVRIAGNVVEDGGLASLEYGVEHLKIPLIMVLGHERCGAVAAALSGASFEGHLPHLMNKMKVPVERSLAAGGSPDLDRAVVENIKHSVQQLKSSNPILTKYLKSNRLKIVGANYDLDTGLIELVN